MAVTIPLSETTLWLVHLDFKDERLSNEIFELGLSCIDPESQAKARRFYHLQDRWRCLIGRILPRVMLKELGVQVSSIAFSATEAGKPFILSPESHRDIAFNITHDNNYVGMAFSKLPSQKIGVDLMKVEIPKGETPRSFAKVLSDQLAESERKHLQTQLTDRARASETIFKYWTTKEAYTKALGIGLGFDFSRVECLSNAKEGESEILVDGSGISGWEFKQVDWSINGAKYMAVVAKVVDTGVPARVERSDLSNAEGKGWVRVLDAVELIRLGDPLS